MSEEGLWRYVVIEPHIMTIRCRPTCEGSCESCQKRPVKDSEVLVVDFREFDDELVHLRLADGRGWVSHSGHHYAIAELVEGLWRYVVIDSLGIGIRKAPTLADKARLGKAYVLHENDVIVSDAHVQYRGVKFLRLADGRGWVFDSAKGYPIVAELAEGLWRYVVIEPCGLGIRRVPTFADNARLGDSCVLQQNDVVVADARLQSGGAIFLRLANGQGWVFTSWNNMQMLAELIEGLWRYVVIDPQGIGIRQGPTYAEDARIGKNSVLYQNDVVVADARVQIADSCFLRLADGRGWVFDRKDGFPMVAPLCEGLWHYTVTDPDGVGIRKWPTLDDSARKGCKHVLHNGPLVVVDGRVSLGGVNYLRLADGRGWAFDRIQREAVMVEVSTQSSQFARRGRAWSAFSFPDTAPEITSTAGDSQTSDDCMSSLRSGGRQRMCSICMVRPCDAVLAHGSTCHQTTCMLCGQSLLTQQPPQGCPVCREPIDRVLKHYE